MKRELGECDLGSSRSVTGVEQSDVIQFGVSTTREAIRLGGLSRGLGFPWKAPWSASYERGVRYLRPIEGSEQFLRITRALGVIDVGEVPASDCVHVVVRDGLSDDVLVCVRELTHVAWPLRRIVMTCGSNGGSGEFAVTEIVDEDAEEQRPSPSPPIPKAG